MTARLDTSSEAERMFEKELEVFRTEANAASQFFYAWLTAQATMSERRKVLDHLNTAPLFWRTMLGALQQSTFIILGRIFDRDKRAHSLYKLLQIAEDNPGMFDKGALGERKKRGSANASEWLTDYLRDKHKLTPADFRRLRTHSNKWRKVYERAYSPIRNRVFAHKEFRIGKQLARFSQGRLFAKCSVCSPFCASFTRRCGSCFIMGSSQSCDRSATR